MEVERPLSVLARPAFQNRQKNPYNWALYSGLRERGVQVHEFALRRCVFGRYDVFHVHWPESTFNSTLSEAIATTRALLFSIDWLKTRGTRVMWTAHNLRAHERKFPDAEAAFWRAFVPRVDGVFALSEAGLRAVREEHPGLVGRPGFVVPHHHYRGQYPDGATRSQARAALALPQDARVMLFFGRILEYKNVPTLIDAFRRFVPAHPGPPALLVIAGKPHDRATEAAVRRAAQTDPRIGLHLRFIAAEETQLFFRAADLVVLPYRDVLNSGSAVLALGFDRPVLMPELGAGPELANLAGSHWVQLYDRLETEVLASALARSASLPPVTDGRHLAALAPARAVGATLDAYREIVRANRRHRSAQRLADGVAAWPG